MELFVESGMEAANNQRLSRWIRYPILFLLGLFFGFVFGMLFAMGLSIMKETIFGGLVIILFDLVLIYLGVRKYVKKKSAK